MEQASQNPNPRNPQRPGRDPIGRLAADLGVPRERLIGVPDPVSTPADIGDALGLPERDPERFDEATGPMPEVVIRAGSDHARNFTAYCEQRAVEADLGLRPCQCPACCGDGTDLVVKGCRCDVCHGTGRVIGKVRASSLESLQQIVIELSSLLNVYRKIDKAAADAAILPLMEAVGGAMHVLDGQFCPQCGAVCDYEPAHEAEPDTNTPAWRGGQLCGCGWTDEREGDHAE